MVSIAQGYIAGRQARQGMDLAQRKDQRDARLADLAFREYGAKQEAGRQKKLDEADALKASLVGGFAEMALQLPAEQRMGAFETFFGAATQNGVQWDESDMQGFNEALLPILEDDTKLLAFGRGLNPSMALPQAPEMSDFREVTLPDGSTERRAIRGNEEVSVPGSRVAASKPAPKPTDIARFQSRYDTQIKEPQSVIRAYQKVAAAADDPSPAGDISLLIGYMKMLDPGSVVRETEFATAENAGGVPERIRNMFNKAQEGTRLTEGQRADFLGQARKLYNLSAGEIERIRTDLAAQAGRQGIEPADFMPAQAVEPIGREVDMSQMSDEQLKAILFGGAR